MSLYNESNIDFNILIRVTQALHKSSNLQEIYKVVLDSVTGLDCVDMAAIYLVDEEKHEAVLQAQINLPEDYLRTASRIPYPKGVTWKAIKSGGIFNTDDIQRDHALGSAGRALGHHSVLGIPISLDEKIIGVIWLMSYKENKFDQKKINTLSTLGDQVAIAVTRAKMFEEMQNREKALSESEARYENLFENIPTGAYCTTPDGRIVMANPALVRMLGYSDFEELASRNLEREGFDVNYPRSQFKKILEEKGEVRGLESAWLKRDGSVLFVLESTRAVRGENGTVLHYEGTVEDITDRKLAEEALKISEERYRALYEDNPSMYFTVSEQGKILSVNRFGAEQLGYSSEELVGRQVLDIFYKDDKKSVLEKLNYCLMNAGQVSNWEFRKVCKDGKVFWVRESARALNDTQGNAIILIVCEDITDRKQTEKALSNSYARLSKKNRYETIVSSVTRSVHKSINLQDVLENAVDAMSKNIDRADIVGIYLVEGDEAVLEAHKGLTDSYIQRAARIQYPKGLTWKTILESNPIYCGDVENDSFIGLAGRELGINSYLSMPIRYEGKTVGTTGINSFEKNAFDEEELKLLEIVVEQIETAINNARQVEAIRKSEDELRKARDELELRVQERTAELASANKALKENLAQLSKKNRYEEIIGTVTRRVHKSIDLQDVLENAVEAMSKNMDKVKLIAIYLVEGEEAVLMANMGHPDWFIERAGRIPYPKGFTWETILKGKPRYCADADEDIAIGAAGREVGIKSYVSMPIHSRGKTVGCMNINSFHKDAFDEDDLKLLEIVAQQLEGAINNARQAEELRVSKEELELRVKERTLELSKINEELKNEIAERKRTEVLLADSKERYRTLVEHTYDLIAETNINGFFLYASPKHKELLGYEPSDLLGTRIFEYIHPDDLIEVTSEFERSIRTISSGKAIFRFRHKKGGWRWLESTGKPFRTASERIVGVIASRDITESKRADELIKESLKEKEVLLKEIHHRVKNNMQVISSLINLQSQYLKNKKAIEMFNETQNRIRSMALIHEHLYQSKNLAMIGFKEYAENLLNNLLYSYEIDPDSIQLKINIEEVSMAIDTAIPCGLIINELVSNSLKYAFPKNRKGEILISLQSESSNGSRRSKKSCSTVTRTSAPASEEAAGEVVVGSFGNPQFTLIVSDNGVGLPDDLDFRNTDSLGLQLVVELTEQIKGYIELDENGGTSFKIKFQEL